MNNFAERTLTSVLFVIVLIGSILLSEFASSLLFMFIIVLCQQEFYSFYKLSDIKPQKKIGMIAGLIFFFSNVVTRYLDSGYNALFFIVPIIYLIFVIELFRDRPNPIQNIAATVLGIIYISVPMTLLHELSFYDNHSFYAPYNHQIVFGFFLILWANDTGAYLIGRKFGKHKLFKRISPKKTWEGSLGGVFLGLIAGYVNGLLFDNLSDFNWMMVALLIIIFGSMGDLVESLFKRSLNIKDSGNLLPGHGGVLDRFDGIFIAAPVVYTYLRLLYISV